MKFALLLALAAMEHPKVTVMAHYCNWHRKEGRENTWPTTSIKPLLTNGSGDGYDSFNPGIIREHNRQMLAEGIVPLISWWGTTSSAGDEFLDHYLAIPSELKVGLLYEADGRLRPNGEGWFDFDDPWNRDRFVSDIRHLNEKYWSRPEYRDRWFRIDDRPVLFIWLTHAFRGKFVDASARAREIAPIFIIGSDFNIDAYIREGLGDVVRGVDALSAYGVYHPLRAPMHGGHIDGEYVRLYTTSYRTFTEWLMVNAPGVTFIPPLMFAFDDRNVPGRNNPPLAETTVDEAYAFARTIRAILEESRTTCAPVWPGILVVSWNEHYEGTGIEATKEYQDWWLRIIRETFSEPLPGSSCQAQ